MSVTKKLFLVLFLGLLLVCNGVVRAQEEDFEDDEVARNEHPGFTDEEWANMKQGEESFEFQAEVSRLMDIIINSLYSNRDIFLRELISNSADALDKIRYQALTDKSLLGEGDDANLEIRISFNEEDQTLTFRDRGVGMTREDLKNNLGTVARSGTTEFVEAAAGESSDALSLIGQFGVGFYSVYLVAERVTVASKNNDDDQYVWESTADATFSLVKDPRGNTLGRGTEITLHMREDAEEFLNEKTLKETIERYSQFVNFPIYLWSSSRVEVEVPVEEAVDEDEDDELLVGLEEDADEEVIPPEMKTVTETVWDWARVNEVKAIWTRAPSEISEEDYNAFYKTLVTLRDPSKYEDPLTHIHFTAEGEITFRSILYVPTSAEPGQYDKYYEKGGNALKLYVRRVLISDEFDEFLPRYLSFIRGVVDSDDLPLNVSRETLAQSRVLKVMAKKLTRKVLEMLRRLAEEDEDDEDEDDEEGVDTGAIVPKQSKYLQFWEQFGKSIKLGIIDDRANKSKLSKLLRFKSSKSEGEYISLEDYVDNMEDDQKFIYYITGESIDVVSRSPLLEKASALDYEVLYMVDALDEYVTQSLTEFDGNPLASVAKEGLRLGGDDDDAAQYETAFEDFSEWLTEALGNNVEKVKVSTRLTSSPCIIVTSQYGWSANMERIMKAQTFNDASQHQHMSAKKTLEINPRHPLIVELKARSESDPDAQDLQDLAELMYDAALVQSGFTFGSPEDFASRIFRVMGASLDVDPAGALVDHDFAADDVNDEGHDEL